MKNVKFLRLAARSCFTLICLFCLGVLAVQAATNYVVPPGTVGITSGIPYNAWTNAATNIQWAVDSAASGDTVLATNGNYALTNQISVTNNITVQTVNGYSNTLVNGNWPAYSNRCFYVTRTGVVDGFTISNGYYDALGTSGRGTNGGAGVYLSTGAIQNCYFVNNVVTNVEGYSGGGGVYVWGAGIVSNCTFVSNTMFMKAGAWAGSDGGGAGVFTKGDGQGIYLLKLTVISNIARGYGGGIYIHSSSPAAVISNCVMSFNYAIEGDGAGIFMRAGTVVDCVISRNNSATYESVWMGGGVLNNCTIADNISTSSGSYCGAALFLRQSATVSNCTISGNRYGGGIGLLKIDSSVPKVDRCAISNNLNIFQKVYYSGNYPLPAGGVSIMNGGLLRNCLISNNSNTYVGGTAGGVYITNSSPDRNNNGVINCTIVNNYTTNTGGGIYALGATNYVVNCVIANNTAPSNSDIYCYDAVNTNNFYYSCMNTSLVSNQGNITNDPAFVNSSAGNWRLANNSPCINTGTNMTWMTNSYDLDGRARIRYGTVDIGAYEKINEATLYHFR